jgi:hypothetical protein
MGSQTPAISRRPTHREQLARNVQCVDLDAYDSAVRAAIASGLLLYRRSWASEAASAYAAWVDGLPDELTTPGAFLSAPPEPFVPPDMQLQPAFAVVARGIDSEAPLLARRRQIEPSARLERRRDNLLEQAAVQRTQTTALPVLPQAARCSAAADWVHNIVGTWMDPGDRCGEHRMGARSLGTCGAVHGCGVLRPGAFELRRVLATQLKPQVVGLAEDPPKREREPGLGTTAEARDLVG